MRPSLRAFLPLGGLIAWCSLAMVDVVRAELEREAPPTVLEIRIDNQAITPITARFLERAITQAEQEGHECVILILDTPGGLVDSTRVMVRRILASEVPVVVYVAPSGARAASAGVFITLAAHVAAMAPGTNIGAAHPVQIGGLPARPPAMPDPNAENDNGEAPRATAREEKIVEDTVAWARSLAELRGRNADWAARAVRESVSAAAREAVEEGAVDLIARNVHDLLEQIDGREVTLPDDEVRELNTADAEIRTFDMWWGERLLALIANPNVAFLLLIFGFYGILFELYAPGWGVAGTLGVVCLLLAFLTLAVLPVNVVGLALLAVAVALFVAEVFVTSYGALAVAGAVCMVLGGVMLVDSPAGFERVSLWVVLPVALATGSIALFLAGSVVKAHRTRQQTGGEAMVGTEATAVRDFSADGDRYAGTVRVSGELWKAVSSSPVAAGERVMIERREGLALFVRGQGARDLRSTSDAGQEVQARTLPIRDAK